MAKERKPWSRPLLIVLGRGRPEENVLQVCKNHDGEYDGTYDNLVCGWKGNPGVCRGVTGT